MRTCIAVAVLTLCIAVAGPAWSAPADDRHPAGAEAGFDRPPVWQSGQTWWYVARLAYQAPGTVFYNLVWHAFSPGIIESSEKEGGHQQRQYYTPDLAWKGVDGFRPDLSYDPVARFEPPIPLYVWPLEPGRKWGRCSTNVVPPGGRHCNSFEVLRYEDLDTKVGRVRAAVIEYRQDGRLLSRRWYSPAVGNLVREEQYIPYQGERLSRIIELIRVNFAVVAARR